MKKRYVKRLIRKLAYFALSVVFLSLLTTLIVERRIRKDEAGLAKKAEPATDFNGDPVTEPYRHWRKILTPRPPRPPVHQARFPRVPPIEAAPERSQERIERKPAGKLDAYGRNESNPFYDLPTSDGPKRDWHDYAAMERDAERIGFGEHGMPAYLGDEADKELETRMSLANGFNALLSDSISINRSLPDVRREGCRHKKYLIDLPDVSIVIPFYNEHFSVLLRSIYSIVNRTPAELLKQIIIVDDFSDRDDVKEQLDDYVAAYLSHLVVIVRLAERTGLIGARLAGARVASGGVLVFFDSHIECNHNWLPPLLEPIAINRNVSTCPIIDTIDHANFAYAGGNQEGSRGGFDWHMLYKQLPVVRGPDVDETTPSRNPVMMGGLFAIGRDFFWQLGGYDEGLDIWGAEQYELSFKIWMCGGMLLDVPCSRVAHIFRGPMKERKSARDYNFVAKNHKRVAEVWMDEYKEFVYNRNPSIFEALDAGDLTEQKAVRERLHCKTFRWFMEELAPDLLRAFPPVEPPVYASGVLQSHAYPQYCLDTLSLGTDHAVGMFPCAANKTHPQPNQFWALTFVRDVRLYGRSTCLDVQDSRPNATVWMWSCHNMGGNQFWYYDREHQWLVHGKHGVSCMEAVHVDGQLKVYANACDASNARMKWLFGQVNNTALDAFYDGVEMFQN